MNLVADESVDAEIVARLRADGYRTEYVAELSPSVSDDEVLSGANAQAALLVTADKDFGELVYRLGRIHSGIVLLRLAGMSPSAKAEAVAAVFRDHGGQLTGGFCVIAPGAIRIRRFPPGATDG